MTSRSSAGRASKRRLSLDLPAGAYTVEWIDTKTGRAAKAMTLEHDGGHAPLASPPFDDDIALRVVAQ